MPMPLRSIFLSSIGLFFRSGTLYSVFGIVLHFSVFPSEMPQKLYHVCGMADTEYEYEISRVELKNSTET